MSHVTGLFTRRGYNIDSTAVGVTENPEVSIVTIVLRGDEGSEVQIRGQLLKLPDVIDVKILPYYASLARELVLVRVASSSEQRPEILGIVEVFGGRIEEIVGDSMLVEMAGNNRQVNGFLNLVAKFGIKDIAPTGQVALAFSVDET